jgi:5-methylcytosine-specific restriction enzyme A
MPWAAKRPCKGGCGVLVVAGFCDECRSKGKAREHRPGWRCLYDARWRKASKAWLERHPVAVDIFGDHGGRVFAAEVVDHKIAHKGDRGLFWDPNNWQGLTKRDHDRKTALEQRGLWPPKICEGLPEAGVSAEAQ